LSPKNCPGRRNEGFNTIVLMTDLERIELRVLELASALDLRPTLERAAEIGELLAEARSQVEHGRWAGWLAKVGLRPRTAWDYMAVANAKAENRWPATKMTIKQFLVLLRRSAREQRVQERQRLRDEVAGDGGDVGLVAHADCRKYQWPDAIDIIATDPPWKDLDAYRWLAEFAANKLKDGGVLVCQCATFNMNLVMNILGTKLNYVWTMALMYSQNRTVRVSGRFRPTWLPVLVYSRGTVRILEAMSDGYTVRQGNKELHDWQQPIEPWRYWLGRLSSPRMLVADPFSGSGTIACVCKELALRFVGTEIDKDAVRVARGRIASHEGGGRGS